jgi:hypothetical protein
MRNRQQNICHNAIFFMVLFAVWLQAPVTLEKWDGFANAGESVYSLSLSVENKPIGEVLPLIEKKTGYKVELVGIDEEFQVTGIFSAVEVERIFSRLFRGYNIAVTRDDGSKAIVITSLGEKIVNNAKPPVQAVAPAVSKADTQPLPETPRLSMDNSDVDPFTGMSSKEVKDLHARQSVLIEKELNNPDTLDPHTGMTLAEIRALHERQNALIRSE